MSYVYFLKSLKNNRVYVGNTKRDPKIRLEEHNRGLNKWTSENGPFKLIYFEKYICDQDAKLREKFYKTGFGRKIKKIIVDLIK
jgi:putative endonuclease